MRDCAVLVIDDEESIRMLLEEGLSSHGVTVACAANSNEALRQARGRSYDILLCDMNLVNSGGVKVSGREVVEEIIAELGGADRPSAIYMTGDLVAPASPLAGSREPRFLQKPFRIADVLTMIQEVRSLKRLENVKG